MPRFTRNLQYWYCEVCKMTRPFRHKLHPDRWECHVCGNEKDFGRR